MECDRSGCGGNCGGILPGSEPAYVGSMGSAPQTTYVGASGAGTYDGYRQPEW